MVGRKETIVTRVFNVMGFRHNMTMEALSKHSGLTKEQVYGALNALVSEGSVTKHEHLNVQYYRRMERARPGRKARKRKGEQTVVNGKLQSAMKEAMEEQGREKQDTPKPMLAVKAMKNTEEVLSELVLSESLDKLLAAAGEIEKWYQSGHVVEADRKKIAELEDKVRRQNEKLGQYEAKITQLQKENKNLDEAGAAVAQELSMIKASLEVLTRGGFKV